MMTVEQSLVLVEKRIESRRKYYENTLLNAKPIQTSENFKPTYRFTNGFGRTEVKKRYISESRMYPPGTTVKVFYILEEQTGRKRWTRVRPIFEGRKPLMNAKAEVLFSYFTLNNGYKNIYRRIRILTGPYAGHEVSVS